MTSDKRDFTDFTKFPGKLSDNDIYTFPLLQHKDTLGRKRLWQNFVRLVKDIDRQSGIDWNLLTEKQVPIREEYFHSDELPKGVIAQVWAETGIEKGKITRNAPSYFDKVAFEGQKNQRNQFQQALIQARSDYLKRKGKLNTDTCKTPGRSKTINEMYFPMLAKPYRDGKKHIKYPVYVQPKLDGARCLAYLRTPNSSPDEVILYTRQKKDIPNKKYLREVLYPYLNDLYDKNEKKSIYLDGELYIHGVSLQKISGLMRNDRDQELLEYHIYDCFYPGEMSTPFSDRLLQLEELFNAVKESKPFFITDLDDTYHPSDFIKLTPTHLVKTSSDVNKLFDKYTKLKYEGVILRNIDGPYKGSKQNASSLRSNDLVKLKQRFSDEFEIVGYTEGSRGKDKGAIIWIAKTRNNHEFKVTPKDTNYQQRHKLFLQAEKDFDKLFNGRLMTIEYEDISDTGVPLRAKAVDFRDE